MRCVGTALVLLLRGADTVVAAVVAVVAAMLVAAVAAVVAAVVATAAVAAVAAVAALSVSLVVAGIMAGMVAVAAAEDVAWIEGETKADTASSSTGSLSVACFPTANVEVEVELRGGLGVEVDSL
jgi:hypothetical protein